MSLVGLGRVKTRRCGEPIEWAFRQIAISAVRILKHTQFRSIRERSFSSFSNFRGFHTAKVMERRTRREQNGSAAHQLAEFIGTLKGFRVVPGADIAPVGCNAVLESMVRAHAAPG
jgi:hypothetical protein